MGTSAKRGASGPEGALGSCASFARQGICKPHHPGADCREMPLMPESPCCHSEAFLPVVDQPRNRIEREGQHRFHVHTCDRAGALRDAQATPTSRQALLPISVLHVEQRGAHRVPAENRAWRALQKPDSVSTAEKWGASSMPFAGLKTRKGRMPAHGEGKRCLHIRRQESPGTYTMMRWSN